MSVGPSTGREYASRSAAAETSVLDRSSVVNDFLSSEVGLQVQQVLKTTYAAYMGIDAPDDMLGAQEFDDEGNPTGETTGPEQSATGVDGDIDMAPPPASGDSGSGGGGSTGPIPDDIATDPPSEQEMADMLGMDLPAEGEEFPDAGEGEDFPEGDPDALPLDVGDEPEEGGDEFDDAEVGPDGEDIPPFEDEPITADDEEEQDESVAGRLISGRITTLQAIALGSDPLYESGLLEPQGNAEEEMPSLEELYDALILRVNTLDMLDYFLASSSDDDVSALYFFFDPRLTEDQAGRLLVRFREVMPGSQVVQMPDYNDEDSEVPWVIVATLYEAELIAPPAEEVDPNMLGDEAGVDSPFDDEVVDPDAEEEFTDEEPDEDEDRIKLDLQVDAKKKKKKQEAVPSHILDNLLSG